MNIIKLPKGNGEFRTIYVPDEASKVKMRACIPFLENRLESIRTIDVNYAFQRGRNCLQHAALHIGFRYSLSLDLCNFFDSLTADLVSDVIPQSIIDICFHQGVARQGFPSSPAISNLIGLKLDEEITKTLRRYQIQCVYSRYADDMTFSFNDEYLAEIIPSLVTTEVTPLGFQINHKKTRLQCSSNGRRIICGIGVGDSSLHVTRKIRRKIRAAVHKGNMRSAKGLSEWAKNIVCHQFSGSY